MNGRGDALWMPFLKLRRAALLDGGNLDVWARLGSVQQAWELTKHTGCGEAVRLIARWVYDIEELTPEAIDPQMRLFVKLML